MTKTDDALGTCATERAERRRPSGRDARSGMKPQAARLPPLYDVRCVMEKEILVRTFIFSLTAAAFAVGFTDQALGQYGPYAAPAAQAHYAPGRQPQGAYGVRPVSTAMRPGTTTYAATPAVGLKPVNPPSAATQRMLMASRTQPTAAPATGAAPPRAAAPVAPPQQYWNSSVNSQPWEASQGAAYGPGGYGGAPAPQADPNMSGGYGAPAGGQCCGNEGGYGGDCGGDCGTSCGHCCCLGKWCLTHTTGDLVQHMPHFGTTHGYYYFRPYHVMHVFSQQELATRWGGDPRNPYDNTIFQQIYQQMGVDAATVKARTEAAAKEAAAAVAQPTQEYVVPTPVPNYPTVPQYNGETVVPPGAIPQGIPQGVMPQGAVPMPTPAVEYVPNK